MPLMTCEELNSVWTIKQTIEKEQRRLEDLRIIAEPSAPILDGMPHAQPLTYKVERIAAMMVDCQKVIDNLVETLKQKKFDLLMKLQSFNLNELQQRVLSYHYVACLKFNEIAKRMHFTKDYTHNLHRRGLRSLGLNVSDMNKLKHSSLFVISSR